MKERFVKICVYLIGFLALGFASVAFAADLGFRYSNGACLNSKGEKGLNPYFFGQCADFKTVVLGRFKIENIDFSGSDFTSADLQESIFDNCNFTGVKLDSFNGSGMSISRSQFHKISARGALFKKTTLSDIEVSESDFSGGNFQNATLSDFKVVSSDFSSAQFGGAKIDSTSFLQSRLVGSQFESLNLANINLKNSNLSKANFSKSILTSAILTQVMADEAILAEAKLDQADLTQASFQKSVLKTASLKGANLGGVNMTGAILLSANLDTKKLDGTVFKDARFNKKTILPFDQSEAIARGMLFNKLLEFTGVLVNKPLSDLDGWKVCYTGTYAKPLAITELKNVCKGDLLMLACRKTGNAILSAAAYGDIKKVLFSKDGNDGTIDNDVKFYFSPNVSLGFAAKDSILRRNTCDTEMGAPEKRICFHTDSAGLSAGWRCGATTGLGGSSTDWERLFLVPE